MTYQLRCFANGVEVLSSTVQCITRANNYPIVGQTIDDRWMVVGVISFTGAEYQVLVEPIQK